MGNKMYNLPNNLKLILNYWLFCKLDSLQWFYSQHSSFNPLYPPVERCQTNPAMPLKGWPRWIKKVNFNLQYYNILSPGMFVASNPTWQNQLTGTTKVWFWISSSTLECWRSFASGNRDFRFTIPSKNSWHAIHVSCEERDFRWIENWLQREFKLFI